MLVADILKRKGTQVFSVDAKEGICDAMRLLAEKKVGALVVLGADGALEGILSEHDIVNAFARHAVVAMELQVGIFMSHEVISCAPCDSLFHVARTMTQRRIRHLPVLDGRDLVGLVSIGDVLKCRIEEIELESRVLRDVAIAMR